MTSEHKEPILIGSARRAAVSRIIEALQTVLPQALPDFEDPGIALPAPPYEAYYTVSDSEVDPLSNNQVAVFIWPSGPRTSKGAEAKRDRVSGPRYQVALTDYDIDVVLFFRKGLYDSAKPVIENGKPLTYEEITFKRAEGYTDCMIEVLMAYAVDGHIISKVELVSDLPTLIRLPGTTEDFLGRAAIRIKITQDVRIPTSRYDLNLAW